jgi:hypothetical protein
MKGSPPAANRTPDLEPPVSVRVHVDGNGTLTAAGAPSTALLLILALVLAGCGATTAGSDTSAISKARPQVIEPTAGVQPAVVTSANPYGDVNAHATPLSVVRHELRLEIVAERVTDARYIDPLQYVTTWERTDQGVDAILPVGAPILAPCRVKILAVTPDWYAGQPLVYFELLDGPDAGKVQYVAEEITDIAPPGSILEQGEAIAHYAKSGTAIEYGWSTPSGITLAVATTGYEEGQITPAGRLMRAWLNSLGANAGPNF